MISFFTKKYFLVDYLKNFVDIHNHILPGIDDGPESVEESVQLLKGFGELGIKSFIATPHIMPDYYDNNPETIRGALDLLRGELARQGMLHIAIEASAEYMIDHHFETLLDQGEGIIPMRKQYVLVEMSYLQPPLNFETAIKKAAFQSFTPILAHPERYTFLHKNTGQYRRYKEMGVLFQLNMLSLSTYYGKTVQRIAHKLLEKNLIEFIASDIHNIRQLKRVKEIQIERRTWKQLLPVLEQTTRIFY
ncbi:MAG: CpsB/CapC family capsule biosynthesis tyrosine phosphatase [Flavobacteriaceae bacterium]